MQCRSWPAACAAAAAASKLAARLPGPADVAAVLPITLPPLWPAGAGLPLQFQLRCAPHRACCAILPPLLCLPLSCLQTVSADDVLTALEDLEFGELTEPLKAALDGERCCCRRACSLLLSICSGGVALALPSSGRSLPFTVYRQPSWPRPRGVLSRSHGEGTGGDGPDEERGLFSDDPRAAFPPAIPAAYKAEAKAKTQKKTEQTKKRKADKGAEEPSAQQQQQQQQQDAGGAAAMEADGAD